jgi:hypothetical protein
VVELQRQKAAGEAFLKFADGQLIKAERLNGVYQRRLDIVNRLAATFTRISGADSLVDLFQDAAISPQVRASEFAGAGVAFGGLGSGANQADLLRGIEGIERYTARVEESVNRFNPAMDRLNTNIDKLTQRIEQLNPKTMY